MNVLILQSCVRGFFLCLQETLFLVERMLRLLMGWLLVVNLLILWSVKSENGQYISKLEVKNKNIKRTFLCKIYFFG